LANDGSTTPKGNSGRNVKRPTSIDKIAKYVHQLADGDDKAAAGHMIASSYIAELRHADRQQARWQKIFYEYRGFVIAASAVITILTGLNLQGNTSFVIRVTTVILSGMITVASGLLELLQVSNRWRLYRILRARLEAITWRTAAHDPEPPAASALTTLGQQFVAAMQDFERHYVSQVTATTDEGDGEPRTKGDEARPLQEQPDSAATAKENGADAP
jgi:Protein of unknown function (DUF4231)